MTFSCISIANGNALHNVPQPFLEQFSVCNCSIIITKAKCFVHYPTSQYPAGMAWVLILSPPQETLTQFRCYMLKMKNNKL